MMHSRGVQITSTGEALEAQEVLNLTGKSDDRPEWAVFFVLWWMRNTWKYNRKKPGPVGIKPSHILALRMIDRGCSEESVQFLLQGFNRDDLDTSGRREVRNLRAGNSRRNRAL